MVSKFVEGANGSWVFRAWRRGSSVLVAWGKVKRDVVGWRVQLRCLVSFVSIRYLGGTFAKEVNHGFGDSQRHEENGQRKLRYGLSKLDQLRSLALLEEQQRRGILHLQGRIRSFNRSCDLCTGSVSLHGP